MSSSLVFGSGFMFPNIEPAPVFYGKQHYATEVLGFDDWWDWPDASVQISDPEHHPDHPESLTQKHFEVDFAWAFGENPVPMVYRPVRTAPARFSADEPKPPTFSSTLSTGGAIPLGAGGGGSRKKSNEIEDEGNYDAFFSGMTASRCREQGGSIVTERTSGEGFGPINQTRSVCVIGSTRRPLR